MMRGMKGKIRMGDKSKINWTDATWNPVTGCSKISTGCKNCYAERMAKRLQAMGQANYADGFDVRLHPHMLEKPLHWKRPRKIFVNSMSDLFHADVPFEYIEEVFNIMRRTRWHTFQILTKRSMRLQGCILTWPKNVWIGVSIETDDYIYRIDHLLRTTAHTKFISFEPLLERIPQDDLNLDGIDWVIVGGESGPGARPMQADWVREIRDKCIETSTPFMFKQWGGVNKQKTGRLLDGRTWDEWPVVDIGKGDEK